MRAHFLLSCRIISDRVLLLLLSTHTHTLIQKGKRERERETRCLSRIDSRHLIFPSFFFLYFSVCLLLLLGLLVAAFPSFRSFPSLYFFKTPPTPHKHTHRHTGGSGSARWNTHTHRQTNRASSFLFPNFLFLWVAPPSRPVVQEMPSNLIGLGEEFAHIQRRQIDGEKTNW